MEASLDEVLAYVRGLNRQTDEACERAGRDPATLPRSLLFDPLGADRAPDGHTRRPFGRRPTPGFRIS